MQHHHQSQTDEVLGWLALPAGVVVHGSWLSSEVICLGKMSKDKIVVMDLLIFAVAGLCALAAVAGWLFLLCAKPAHFKKVHHTLCRFALTRQGLGAAVWFELAQPGGGDALAVV